MKEIFIAVSLPFALPCFMILVVLAIIGSILNTIPAAIKAIKGYRLRRRIRKMLLGVRN